WWTAAAGSASSTRRWSTRPGRGSPSGSAPAPAGARRSRATACWYRRRRASQERCPSGRARAWDGRTSSARRSARLPASWRRSPTRRPSPACRPTTCSTSARRRTSSPSCASRRAPPEPSLPTGQSWSSASAMRSATGAFASSRPSAAGCTRRGRWRPGERTPLWQQRLKAQSLLQVARRYPAFPVVLETYRECLQDVFDLPALKRLLSGLRTRQIDLVEVETASASPYAASLLFDYVANYMYEDDTPAAERRAQALSLDRDLLKELLGQEELRDLIDPGALAEVEEQLRGAARTPDELHDLLRRRGDLRAGEYPGDLAEPLLAERRAVRVRVAGEERLIAAEDAGRYRDAVGAMPPGGLPEVFLEADDSPLESLVRRFARSRGPFTTAQANERFGRDVEPTLRELERRDELVRGELRPGGSEREWCDPEVLRRLRRASLAALRREVEPVEQAAFGRFLPSWHGVGRRAFLREALVPLQGLALPVSLWESDVLPCRVPGYRPEQLDALSASGEVVWVGAGLDRVAIYFRDDA